MMGRDILRGSIKNFVNTDAVLFVKVGLVSRVLIFIILLFIGQEIGSGQAGALPVTIILLLEGKQTGNGAAAFRSIPAFIWSEFWGRFSDSPPESKLGWVDGL